MKDTDYASYELLDMPVIVVTADLEVVFANSSWQALCSERYHQSWLDCIDPADRSRVQAAWQLSIDQKIPFSCDCRLDDGKWVSARARAPSGQSSLWVLSFTEVSQYKTLEKELLARESLLERVFANRHAAIACLDRDFNFIRVNTAYAEVDEKAVEYFPGKNHFELYPSEENRQLFERVRDSGEPHVAWARAFEYEANPERGVTHWDWSLWPVRNDSGEVEQLLLVLVDVTRRVRAEEELASSRLLSDVVLESANALLVVLSGDGRILRFNRACEKLTGWSREEMLGQRVWEWLIPPEQVEPVKGVFSSLTREALPNEYVNEWLTRDGERRMIRWHNSVVADDDGQVDCVACVGIDETDKYEALEDTSRNRARFEAIFNAMPDAVIFTGPDHHIISINPAAEQVFGCTREELIGQHCSSLCKGDENGAGDVHWMLESMQSDALQREVECLRSNGEVFWGQVVGDRVSDDKGTLLGYVAIVRDTSAERTAREDLLQTRRALDNAVDAISYSDARNRVTYVNRAFLDLWGFEDASEVLGTVNTTLVAEGGEEALRAIQRDGSWIGELRARRKDGGEVDVRIAAQASFDLDGRPAGVMVSIVDISDLKRVEHELQRKEEILAQAQAIANMGSWDWNILSGELAWSAEIYRLFGWRPNEFPANYDAFLKTIHPDDRQRLIRAVEAAVAGDKVYDIEHRIVRPDGEERVVHEKGQVYRDEDGKPVRMIGTVHDVTEERRVQETLTSFKSTLDMTLDCVFMFDAESLGFFYVNQGAMDQVGYTQDELMQMHPYDIKPDYDEAGFRALLEPMISGEVPVRFFETRHRSRSGRDVPVEIFLQYIRPRGQSPRFVAIVRDISERRKNEAELEQYREHLEDLVQERTRALEQAHDQLVRQERLATLGQLTATVSHELRNPLGAIKSSMYVLEKKLADSADERLQDVLRRVDRNVARCDHIIDELLDFTRIKALQRHSQQLGPWVRELLDELSLAEAVALELDLPGDGVEVSFDGSRLRRAIINVVDNACQAMLEDESVDTYRPGARLTVILRAGPERAELIFRDNGPGIPPETLERIFEPLFSTKGFGVGLGMSAVLQIMTQHGGGVDVASVPGAGAEVCLWLPGAAGASEERLEPGQEKLN